MSHDLCVNKQVPEIIEQYSNMVYRLAFSLVKNKFDAEDIYQDVFMKYIHKKPVFKNSEHERAWFIRVTVNMSKNLWKRARRREVSLDVLNEQGGASDRRTGMPEGLKDRNIRIVGETSTDGYMSDEERLTDEEEHVVEAVGELSSKYRVVIHLFYYEELSIEEIAGALNLKPSNVRTRLTRARKMLKEKLKEDI